MAILIKSDETKTYSFGTSRVMAMATEKHEVYVSSTSYNAGFSTITVIVNNAAHRAYKGGGRNFNSLSEAIAHYKTPEIKSMLQLIEA